MKYYQLVFDKSSFVMNMIVNVIMIIIIIIIVIILSSRSSSSSSGNIPNKE